MYTPFRCLVQEQGDGEEFRGGNDMPTVLLRLGVVHIRL